MTLPNLAPNLGHVHRRLRRLRSTQARRDLCQEFSLNKKDFIVPIFVSERSENDEPIASLPGVSRLAEKNLKKEVESCLNLGAKAVMLFPVVHANLKSLNGQEAYRESTLAARSAQSLKETFPEIEIFADVALDPYTSHGHDGILNSSGVVDNDLTVQALVQQSLLLARSGVDFVSPSDMMDGRIAAIRWALDQEGFTDTGILAYSAKFASAFYGPFREAVASGARGLDKRTYQLSTSNARQALLEAQFDEDEGADIILVKPILCYLDILSKIKAKARVPVCTYHVSGEYAMLKAAVERGWIDETPAVLETLLSIKRAGADLIISYYAKWALQNLF